MVKLLALDLDGTCLNWNNKISSKTMAALEKKLLNKVSKLYLQPDVPTRVYLTN